MTFHKIQTSLLLTTHIVKLINKSMDLANLLI